ncbi:MAG: septum site-determining protein MinC [Pseudanabaena sp. CRU_2_10]|nr:septum site-determining protein MinC [Pseudanabaena sp. CRU_2_10]
MSVEESKIALESPPRVPKSLAEEGFLTVDISEESTKPSTRVLEENKPDPTLPAQSSSANSSSANSDNSVITQVRFKTIDGKLTLLLPAEAILKAEDGSEHVGTTWSDLLEQLQQHLSGTEQLWQPGTLVYLPAGDRLLDARQLHELAEALQANQLILHSVATLRRQTAIAAATLGLSVEQGKVANSLTQSLSAPAEPLYVKMTVRSGTEIRHPGSVIVFGDVNAGAEVIADGDILVWGKLKGRAHAGASGNTKAAIAALHLEATQLRIGDYVARVDTPTTQYSPEVAHISTTGTPAFASCRLLTIFLL